MKPNRTQGNVIFDIYNTTPNIFTFVMLCNVIDVSLFCSYVHILQRCYYTTTLMLLILEINGYINRIFMLLKVVNVTHVFVL